MSRRRFLAAGFAFCCIVAPFAGRSQSGDAFRVLRAGAGSLRLRDSRATPVTCFDGVVPGPLLRTRPGEELAVRVGGDLTEPLAIHWHGIRGANALDGLPPSVVVPGVVVPSGRDYRLTTLDAGTFWYRALGRQGRALYGPLIVDEASGPAVDRDVILVLDNWRLRTDGTLDETNPDDVATVNGASPFSIPARTNERLRLRLINAGDRIFPLRIERHEARVMAVDGQPAQPFLARDGRLALAPGNRIDLFVDALLPPGSTASLFTEIRDQEIVIGQIVYAADRARDQSLPVPDALPANPLPDKIDLGASLKAWLMLDDRSRLFASLPLPQSRPLETPQPVFTTRRGRPVTLSVTNRTPMARVIHPHGHTMRLLDRFDDGWKPFWLDTVLIEPGATVRLAFVTDFPGRWLIESRPLRAREPAEAAWFDVF